MIGAEWLFAAPALVALLNTVCNGFSWPRPGPSSLRALPAVSVLIPARNEARNIEAAVRSAAACVPAPAEIVVYDDGSTDETPQILARLAAEIPTLRVLSGVPLPAGWVGKPHAAHRLAAAARGEHFVFLDADVTVRPDAIGRIAATHARYHADVVTAVPRQITGSPAEELVIPVLHLTYVAWLPLALVWASPWTSFLAANGQVLSMSRETYVAIGGFQAVRSDVVDDMAICRNAKRLRRRVVFADGHELADCRMYADAPALWAGFSKNVYAGVGSGPALLLVIALYLWAFVLPYLALPLAAVAAPALVAPAATALAANVVMRALLAVRHGHSARAALLHPVAILAVVAIALNSWRWARAGRIAWSGRTYALPGSPRA